MAAAHTVSANHESNLDVGAPSSGPDATVTLSMAELEALIDRRASQVLARELARDREHVGEAPTNFHQATIYFCIADVAPLATKLKFQFGSWSLVLLQMFVVIGLFISTQSASCMSTVHCPSDQVCVPNWQINNKDLQTRRCRVCSDEEAVDFLTEYFPNVGEENFTCPVSEYRGECEACYDLTMRAFTGSSPYERIDAMLVTDWLALVIASGVIALAVAKEIQDIILCRLTYNRLLQAYDSGYPKSTLLWNASHQIIAICRRFVVLPGVMSVAALLVSWRGADILSISLNTVAVLFLLDLDNLAYDFALPAKIRSLVDQQARAELDVSASIMLSWTKVTHCLVVVVFIPTSVITLWKFEIHPDRVFELWIFLLTLVAMLEAWKEMSGTHLGSQFRAVAIALAKAMLGFGFRRALFSFVRAAEHY